MGSQPVNMPRPFAALDAGLLARKGEAAPALSQETKMLADVGFGHGAALPDAQMPVRKGENRPRIAKRPRQRSKLPPGKNPDAMARLTFQLPMADYIRLKVASITLGKPSRQILLEALSCHLSAAGVQDFNACPCLNASQKAKSAKS